MYVLCDQLLGDKVEKKEWLVRVNVLDKFRRLEDGKLPLDQYF